MSNNSLMMSAKQTALMIGIILIQWFEFISGRMWWL